MRIITMEMDMRGFSKARMRMSKTDKVKQDLVDDAFC